MQAWQRFAGYFYAILSAILAAIYWLGQNYWRDPDLNQAVPFLMLLVVATISAIYIARCALHGDRASLLARAIVLGPILILVRFAYVSEVDQAFVLVFIGLYAVLGAILIVPTGD